MRSAEAWFLVLLLLGACMPGRVPGGGPAAPAPPHVLGVTIDSIDALDEVVAALARLPAERPYVRVVFDRGVGAVEYLSAVEELSRHADVMGGLVDSSEVKNYSLAEYRQRAEEYREVLGPHVAIWETGNEVNGEWLGPHVMEKILAAHSVFEGLPRSVNFYFNRGCYEKPEHEMFRWIGENVPAGFRDSVEWVLFSYYEDDCKNRVVETKEWEAVFTELGRAFPRSRLGFGEVGACAAADKETVARRYYSLRLRHPRFIGGYFWWYFWQDRAEFHTWIEPVWTRR